MFKAGIVTRNCIVTIQAMQEHYNAVTTVNPFFSARVVLIQIVLPPSRDCSRAYQSGTWFGSCCICVMAQSSA